MLALSEFSPLYSLSVLYGTDKGVRHQYTEVYYDLFKDRIDGVRGVFEFGVKMGASLRMWRDFFPNAMIFGFDKKERNIFAENRIRTFLGDQNIVTEVQSALLHATAVCPLDLIIDDCSHKWLSQIYTARFALPFLAEDGIYIIEDVNSPGGKDDPHNIRNKFPGYKTEMIRTTSGTDSVMIVIRQK